MALLWLVLAVGAEVAGTVSLKFSEGFTRLVPALVVVCCYGVAFYALSQTLRLGMPLGAAYGIWAAVGVALLAVIGTLFLDERLSLVQVGGVALVILGVLALEMGGAG